MRWRKKSMGSARKRCLSNWMSLISSSGKLPFNRPGKNWALHILLNIVGSNELSMIPTVDLKKWNEIFKTNVNSVVIGVQACAPLMKESGGGSIVNIGSVAGIT